MADTLDEITCPACGKPMKKVEIKNQHFNVDICLDGCGGIFFDNRELKKVDEEHENIDDILKEIEGKTFEKVNESETRICPVCGHNMVKNHTSHLRKIEMDECYNCGGIFLDNNELQKLRAEFKTENERSSAFMEYANKKIIDFAESEKVKELRNKYFS